MNIDTIVTENRALLHRMRELNMRAGREVFPIPTHEDLQRRFVSGLHGARRVREITNWDALRLPSLDQEVVNNLLAGCPDTIMVLGMSIKVDYEDEYGGIRRDPRVKLPSVLISNRAWLNLPDEGVSLPNGRKVAVVFSPRYDDWVGGTDIPALKEKVRESLNRGLWERWNRPELPAPLEAIAPIVERQYGRCVVTDVPLIAYGILRQSLSSWYTHWTRDRAEAEQVHEQSCRRFAEKQEEVRRSALTRQVGELYMLHRNNVPEELSNRMYYAIYGLTRQSVVDLEAIIAEVKVLLKPKVEMIDSNKIDLSQLFGGGVRVTR